jgi:hypothetical protein
MIWTLILRGLSFQRLADNFIHWLEKYNDKFL